MWSIAFMTIADNEFEVSQNISRESPPIRFPPCSPPSDIVWTSIDKAIGYPLWSSCVFPKGAVQTAHSSPYMIID